jgi:hypothetical protein
VFTYTWGHITLNVAREYFKHGDKRRKRARRGVTPRQLQLGAAPLCIAPKNRRSSSQTPFHAPVSHTPSAKTGRRRKEAHGLAGATISTALPNRQPANTGSAPLTASALVLLLCCRAKQEVQISSLVQSERVRSFEAPSSRAAA